MPQFKLKAKDSESHRENPRRPSRKPRSCSGQSRLTSRPLGFRRVRPGQRRAPPCCAWATPNTRPFRRAPLYVASLSRTRLDGPFRGIPIEEFISEEVPKTYQGLEVIQVDPIRPLTISTENKPCRRLPQAEDTIRREFEQENIALIRTPHESDWMISVMRYLNECDRAFPGPRPAVRPPPASDSRSGPPASPSAPRTRFTELQLPAMSI